MSGEEEEVKRPVTSMFRPPKKNRVLSGAPHRYPFTRPNTTKVLTTIFNIDCIACSYHATPSLPPTPILIENPPSMLTLTLIHKYTGRHIRRSPKRVPCRHRPDRLLPRALLPDSFEEPHQERPCTREAASGQPHQERHATGRQTPRQQRRGIGSQSTASGGMSRCLGQHPTPLSPSFCLDFPVFHIQSLSTLYVITRVDNRCNGTTLLL